MYLFVYIINLAFEICIVIIVLQVAISWLINFDVINAENPKARNLIALLKKVTDPVYVPLRKYIPTIGGMDFTPLIVILGLSLLQSIIIGAIH